MYAPPVASCTYGADGSYRCVARTSGVREGFAASAPSASARSNYTRGDPALKSLPRLDETRPEVPWSEFGRIQGLTFGNGREVEWQAFMVGQKGVNAAKDSYTITCKDPDTDRQVSYSHTPDYKVYTDRMGLSLNRDQQRKGLWGNETCTLTKNGAPVPNSRCRIMATSYAPVYIEKSAVRDVRLNGESIKDRPEFARGDYRIKWYRLPKALSAFPAPSIPPNPAEYMRIELRPQQGKGTGGGPTTVVSTVDPEGVTLTRTAGGNVVLTLRNLRPSGATFGANQGLAWSGQLEIEVTQFRLGRLGRVVYRPSGDSKWRPTKNLVNAGARIVTKQYDVNLDKPVTGFECTGRCMVQHNYQDPAWNDTDDVGRLRSPKVEKAGTPDEETHGVVIFTSADLGEDEFPVGQPVSVSLWQVPEAVPCSRVEKCFVHPVSGKCVNNW